MDALNPEVIRVTPSQASYPHRLRHLPDPPGRLFVRGDLGVLEAPCVTIVGSRRSTRYGRRVAWELAGAAVRAGWTVVSGLALGVDGAAHRGALDAGGMTVAVLGSGPDRAQPRAHAGLMEEVLVRGSVLSEHAPGVAPRRHHFPRRNRLLAALASRVVVVEAAVRSGALLTAGLAAELGVDVWAVPGSVFSPCSRGTHGLLEDGAIPVTSLDAWEASLADAAGAGGGAGAATPEPQLALGPGGTEAVRAVWGALAGEPSTVEALAVRCGLSPGALLPVLTRLELDGWVRREPGPVFVRRAA